MLRTVVLVLSLHIGLPAFAQIRPLTLEDALRLAEERSETIAAARAGLERARHDERRARSGLFPQLSLFAGYDRTLASEFEDIFRNFQSTDPSAGDFSDLPFGRENIWRLNLSLSQNLFSGGRLGAQQSLASAGRSIAEVELTISRAQLLLDVTQAFYDAALGERFVAIAAATLRQAEAAADQVKLGFEAGRQPEFELLRARVARDNQVPLLIRQRANHEVALIRLKQLLDLPDEADLRLAVSLEDAADPPPVFAARVAEVEARGRRPATLDQALAIAAQLRERAPVQEAAAVVRSRQASLEAARAEQRPSVSLSSDYGRVGYPSGFLPRLDRTNWTLGFAVTLPLLTGGRLQAEQAAARADVEQSRAQLQQVRELAAVDSRSAIAELVAARAAWDAGAGSIEQAVRAHQIAEVRFREGISTQLELSDARLQLQQAEANRAQAARDLQIARARVALLPGLPLGPGSGVSQPAQVGLRQPRAPAAANPGTGPANASPQGAQLGRPGQGGLP